jgi:hypothetical protein
MHRARCAAVATIVLFGFAATSAAKHSSFADHLASTSSSSGVPSYAGTSTYEPTEIQEACLRETANRNCRDAFLWDYFE